MTEEKGGPEPVDEDAEQDVRKRLVIVRTHDDEAYDFILNEFENADAPIAAELTEHIVGGEGEIAEALCLLRVARELLKAAGAPRAADAVRRAMKSAEGAQRHAGLAWVRRERQEGGAK